MAKKQKMNKTSASAAISNAFSMVDDLKGELQDWYDNLPENFQNGDKGSQLQEAIDQMEQDSEPSIEETLQQRLESIEVEYAAVSGRQSRSDRRYEAISMLQAAIEVLAKFDEADETEDDLKTLIDELESAVANWEGVEFPGMFG